MTATLTNEERERLLAGLQGVYERQGAAFDRDRARTLFEKCWLDRFLALIPPGGALLDAGCGGGEPIARYLMERGHPVTGVDRSESLLAIARVRFPGAQWLRADMRTLNLSERFAGIVGWHSFFHLTPDEQRSTLAVFARHLLPGGALLLTVGPRAGEVVGTVGGEPVYHASLDPEAYETALRQLGLSIRRFIGVDPACDLASVLLAQKD